MTVAQKVCGFPRLVQLPPCQRVRSAFNTNTTGQVMINGVRPDADDLQGGYAITFSSKVRAARGVAERAYPALQISGLTGMRAIRVKGEQVGFAITGNAAPTFWRMGAMQMDIAPSSARR